jgi:Mg2+/Co2+ transporter CorC
MSARARSAVIDVGSNTIHLLVGEVEDEHDEDETQNRPSGYDSEHQSQAAPERR